MHKTVALLSLFFCSVVLAQSFNKAKMDEFMNALEQNNKFSGSVALLDDQHMVYSRAVGFADAENKVKNTADTKFRIGSITKTFTAVLIMKAVEEKKLKLTDRLSNFFPEIKNAGKITISHLLSHRSGIPNVTARPDYLLWNQTPKTQEEMLQLIAVNESDFNPGLKMNYSNSGYILLTFILEKIYGKSYSEILEEKITKPLALHNTYYGGKINSANAEAYSYNLFDMAKSTETDMSVPSGAGAIVSTTTDLLKFIGNLFRNRIVTAASLAEMTKMTDNYGYGLFSVPFHDNTGFGHNGGIDGFSSALYYFPELKIGYVMLSNGSSFDNNKIAIAAMRAATGKEVTVPDFKTVQLNASLIKNYVGTYSSTQIPLKIEVREKEGLLFAQATGQGEFPLQATSENTFVFEEAGIEMVFDADHKKMTLNQAGMKIPFTKE